MGRLIIKGVSKVNEFADPELLQPNEVTKLENMVLDSEGGKAVKRGGFVTFNSNDPLTPIYSLHDVIDSSGANYLLAASGTEFKKSLNGTSAWTTVKSGLTSNIKTRLAAYNGKFIVTNGINAPFMTDLSTVWDIGIARPVVSSVTTTHLTGGGLTPNSKYKWCLVYVTSIGEKSNPSVEITHYVAETSNNSTTGTYQSVALKSLPVSSDSRVTTKLLYRTKANDNVFYLIARLNAGVTQYNDTNPDTALDLSETIEYIDNPTIAKYVTVHKERSFLANLQFSILPPDVTHAKKGNGQVFHGTAYQPVGGSLAAGTYSYKVIFVNQSGYVSTALTIEAAVTVTAPNNAIKLQNVPTRPDASMSRQVYRSFNSGSYFLMFFGDQSSDDILYDSGEDTPSTTTIPSPSSGSSGYKCGVIFSEIGKPAQMNITDPANPDSSFLIQVFPDDGDEITGILDFQDRVLVFKKNSICQIITLGNPLNWRVEKIHEQIGCDQPDSIQRIGDRIYFMNNLQVYRFPDYINTPISNAFRKTFATVTAVHDSGYSNYYQWYVLLVSLSGTKYVVVYDEKLETEKLETWYKFSNANLSWQSVIEKQYGSYRGGLLFGHSGFNTVSKYDTGSKVDRTSDEINCLMRTKTFTLNDPTAKARLRELWANYKKRDNQLVTHRIFELNVDGEMSANDSANSGDYSKMRRYRKTIDDMGTAREHQRFYYEISGTGLDNFDGAAIHYRILNRGSRG